jgi:FkbM family methyltransferase
VKYFLKSLLRRLLFVMPGLRGQAPEKPDHTIAGLQLLAAAFPKLEITVLDIGARYGAMTSELSGLAHYANVSLTGVEPDKEEAERLRVMPGALAYRRVVPVAVWSSECERELHITAHKGCSSVLAPDTSILSRYSISPIFEVTGKVPVALTILDTLFADAQPFDIVKIDVQGGELEVLTGGNALMDTAIGLICETHTIPIYRDERTFDELHRWCREHGFRLIHLQPGNSFDGEVVELNCAYIRDPADAESADVFLKELLFTLSIRNLEFAELMLRNWGERWLGRELQQQFFAAIGQRSKAPQYLPDGYDGTEYSSPVVGV